MSASASVDAVPDHTENTLLRQTAIEISQAEFDDGTLSDLIGRLNEILADGGVGLAAPQICVPKRVFIMQDLEKFKAEVEPRAYEDRKRKDFKTYAVINPRILKYSPETVPHVEACLSIKGYAGVVNRHEWIEVEFLDEAGRTKKTRLQDYEARIFQNEFDHLEGIFYSDEDRLVGDNFVVQPKPEETELRNLTLAEIEAMIDGELLEKSTNYPDRALRRSPMVKSGQKVP